MDNIQEYVEVLRERADNYPANMMYDRHAEGYVEALRAVADELEAMASKTEGKPEDERVQGASH